MDPRTVTSREIFNSVRSEYPDDYAKQCGALEAWIIALVLLRDGQDEFAKAVKSARSCNV